MKLSQLSMTEEDFQVVFILLNQDWNSNFNSTLKWTFKRFFRADFWADFFVLNPSPGCLVCHCLAMCFLSKLAGHRGQGRGGRRTQQDVRRFPASGESFAGSHSVLFVWDERDPQRVEWTCQGKFERLSSRTTLVQSINVILHTDHSRRHYQQSQDLTPGAVFCELHTHWDPEILQQQDPALEVTPLTRGPLLQPIPESYT